VIGLGLLGLGQLVLVGVVGLAIAGASGGVELDGATAGTLAIVLAWFVLGYSLYATMYGATAALVSRQEDLQSATTPLTIALVVSFLLASPAPDHSLGLALVVLGVDLGELRPLVGQLVLGKARVHRTGLHAGVAIDALLGVDVELLDLVVVGFLGRRVNAVDGTDLDARVVLRADAGLCDDVGHISWGICVRNRPVVGGRSEHGLYRWGMAVTSRILGARGRRQAEKLGIDPARVPPGQYFTEKFPVLTVGPNPSFDLSTWDLAVFGLVGNPLTLSWDELMAMPQKEVVTDIHCVTRWSKLDITWRGIPLSEVLGRARVKPHASHVMAYSEGGYTTNLPLDVVLDDDALLAHTYDGEPLEPDHGAPMRLLVPKRYFWKSAKFLRKLELMSDDRMGFWELNGYHNNADPGREERHWF
jgi:DMSO/TMAO reductase YedYZ molybdopterin-dependent catalytic subunit